MKFNPFQQAEIDSHNDPELQWIIQENIALFAQNKANFKDGKFRPMKLFLAVGIEVSKVICNREGFDSKNYMLTESEAANYLWHSYNEKYPDSKQWPTHKSYDELVLPFLDTLINASLLRTRVPLQTENYYDNYWPFGQEGGFCNSNKIQELNNQ